MLCEVANLNVIKIFSDPMLALPKISAVLQSITSLSSLMDELSFNSLKLYVALFDILHDTGIMTRHLHVYSSLSSFNSPVSELHW